MFFKWILLLCVAFCHASILFVCAFSTGNHLIGTALQCRASRYSPHRRRSLLRARAGGGEDDPANSESTNSSGNSDSSEDEQVNESMKKLQRMGQVYKLKDYLSKIRRMDSDEIISGVRGSSGNKMDIGQYTKAMAMLAMVEKWKGCTDLIIEMEDAGVPPDVACYTIAITAACRKNSMSLALKYITDMKKKRNLEPTPLIYGIILNAYYNSRQFAAAIDVYESLQKRGFQFDSLGLFCVVGSYAGKGRISKALGALKLLKALEWDPQRLKFCYMNCVNACVEWGRWELAFSIIQEMDEQKINAETDWKRNITITYLKKVYKGGEGERPKG